MLPEATIKEWIDKYEKLDELGRILLENSANTLLNHQRIEERARQQAEKAKTA